MEYESRKDSSVEIKSSKIFNANTVLRIITLILLVLTLPVITVCSVFALLYKILCSVVIKRNDKLFVEFLENFDVFWNLEDDANIITVLGVIESESPETLVEDIKCKLRNILPNESIRKLFYRRNEKYGFYYWRRHSDIDMDEYVRLLDIPEKSNIINTNVLEEMMSELYYQSLPYNDKGLFEILVTKQRVGNYKERVGDYGILFRIHHSVGDGVALIDFFCKTFAENSANDSVNLFQMPGTYVQSRSILKEILHIIQKVYQIPLCIIDAATRKPDINLLHGPPLNGKKIFKWTQYDENLLSKVKEIKNIGEFNFSDVLAMALSSGLRHYFSKTTHIPENIAVILPIRYMRSSADRLKLGSNISVAILDLPIKDKNINNIRERCNTLRKSTEPLINYYFVKLTTYLFPKQILHPVLHSKNATMVFSNMPGPCRLSICGNNVLKSLVFFIPNKGLTGLGITALCYDGVLRFAAMADTAVLSDPDHLSLILDGMVDEINSLHQQFVKK